MRTTNLIQTYINNNPTTQQYQSDKVSKNFDVHRELSNRTFIKPLPSNGKLLNPTIMDYPAEIQKDIKYDMKAFYHAMKGEANDHELGRLNDVGMKFGGLALAAYLFTKKQTPKTKIFEFIGFGTFFAAMDLWPKLFIQLPAKLIHGVNVRQEYEDSFGRKKMFYQDHQFLPWDLYSDDEINKIGDRLHVPKDIPNRRNAIQEKMRQIALQNNTLWMLTSGFATPLLSALLCNAVDKTVSKVTDMHMNSKADKLLSNFTKEIQKYDFSKSSEELSKILKENEGKPITSALYESILKNMSNGLDKVIADALDKDLKKLLPIDKKYTVSENGVANIQKTIQSILKPANLPEDVIARIIPTAEKISEHFGNRGLLNGEYDEFSEHSKIIQNIIDENITAVSEGLSENDKSVLKFYKGRLIHSPELNQDSPLFKTLKLEPKELLTQQKISTLKSVADRLNTFKAESSVLDRYSFIKVAQAPETGLANIWNKTSDEMFKAMNFTQEEIRLARIDNEIATDILRNKMEALVANKESYAKFIEKMEDLLSNLYSKTEPLNTSGNAERENLYKTLVNTTCDNAGNDLLGKGMKHTAASIVGVIDRNNNVVSQRTSAKHLMMTFVDDRIKGVKSSFYRFLNLADLYYRIAHLEGNTNILNERVPREIKEEMVELAKQITLEGHTSDFAVKFWQLRNPEANKTDYSQIKVKDGKVINQYMGVGEHECVEFSNDRHYFDSVMKLMYGEDVHPDTYAKIKNSGFWEDFKKYRQDVLEIIGGDRYFAKHNHLVNEIERASSSEERFILTGCAPSDMAYKAFNNMFNSGKWFSVFGKLGAGLIGVTLLAQFLIGRNKTPWKNKEVQ